MRSRLLAFVIAVGMVAGAIVIRGRIDQHHENTSHPLRLVCSNELRAACEALPGSIQIDYQQAGDTASSLLHTDTPAIDGWLVAGPWPQMVDALRRQAGMTPLFASTPSLATTPVVIVAWPDRAQVLTKNCPGLVLKCVVTLAPRAWAAIGGQAQWGSVKVSMASPQDDATALDGFAAATASYFGSSDLSSAQLDDDGFRAWEAGLVHAVTVGSTDQMISGGPALADFGFSLEAITKPQVQAAAPERRPSLLYPSSVVSADAVFGGFASDRSRRLEQQVRSTRVLLELGWKAGRGTGLPSPGFLDALRSAWGEVR